MEQYQTLIGVVIEKLGATHKELQHNCNGLGSILSQHSEEERLNTPELLTIQELHDGYKELLETLERRYPGLKQS
ncbi:hypothetical protein [Paenibacillus sp. YYML68]|uniref:hypothetical protein n=1 Tax=Paenibacillus sp. YYML68 TaxID=2909250 RepID=UPI002490DC1D|nr:hypothetical protein [Paenibacillus sp. YYML68]